MAQTLTILNLLTILSLLLFQTSLSFEDEGIEVEYYLLDSLISTTNAVRSRASRFLASAVKKGARCGAATSHGVACDGVRANNGTCLLYCCKKHCRNVLGDHNNCGVCGHKCRFAERCCSGVCTNVLGNTANCGNCGRKCPRGVECEFGNCGYA
ncbi:protein GRIM REAPER-like [Salvia divinorum]|uniref:Protein GRIM REAPER-like n=1 Tax=Salvia divinorum TaxID=28513 RepID=A0ABD1G0U6_SALDI